MSGDAVRAPLAPAAPAAAGRAPLAPAAPAAGRALRAAWAPLAWLLSLTAAVTLSAPAAAHTAPDRGAWPDLSRFADPFVGTDSGAPDFGTGGGAGATFPGAARPFGMVQFGPDTIPTTTNFAGGYSYGDTRLRGFSLTHFSGAGCALYQDVPFTPVAVPIRRSPVVVGSTDVRPEFSPAFAHRAESASPGRYAVVQDPATRRAIASELSVTTRTGVARFTYPATRDAGLIINAGGSANANRVSEVSVDPRRREVSGMAESGRFCSQPTRYRVFFVARFDRPFARYGTGRDDSLVPGSRGARDVDRAGTGNYKPVPGGPASVPGNPSSTAQAGAFLTWDARSRRAVGVQIGVSFASLAGARRNLEAERVHSGVDEAASATQAVWREALGHARVRGGTRTDLRLYATSLYHALLFPSVFSDADGRYRGMDGHTHRARGFTKLANVSGWDVYRTQAPLLAMLFPGRAGDLAASLLADARESGCLPRWPYADQQTNVMVGDPSDAILASAWAFGARRFDARAALRVMVRGASRPCHTANGDYTQREALAEYRRLGYVPHELGVDVFGHTLTERARPWGDAATTLEYALADGAIARLAQALGKPALARDFDGRAVSWRRLVNPTTRSIEPRLLSGAFLADADPASDDGYVEGNGAQYQWLVPHDPAGLFASMGGRVRAAARLDRFFSRLNAGPERPFAFLGNEPNLGVPWLYDWLGRPERTQAIVRRALLALYRPTPQGMPGNDDGGTMSAWWVLGALGLYPAIPGADVIALNSPLFREARLRTGAADVRIVAPDAARGRPYVRALTLDGRALDRPWLRWGELGARATLRFALSARPGSRWGTAARAAPPSYGPH